MADNQISAAKRHAEDAEDEASWTTDPEKSTVHPALVDSDSGTVTEGKLGASDDNVARKAYRGLRSLAKLERRLGVKLGIETQGIDHIAEHERQPPSLWNAFFLWASFNLNAPSLTLGVLGAELGLSLHLSVAACIVGIVVGALLPAFSGTLGPKLGLRQIASARFSFGLWGTRLCVVLNLVTLGGFYIVALITMGELLSAASDYSMSVIVGIVIVAVIAYCISFFGYRVLQAFERYSWILAFVMLCVLLGQAAPHANASAPSTVAGLAKAGSFLSLVAVHLSNSAGWCTSAADFLVNYPPTISRWRIAGLVYSGVVVFITFPVVVGTVIGNVGLFGGAHSPYHVAYEAHGFGGLVSSIYHPNGWRKVALVFLSMSALGNSVGITYSAGLSLQTLGPFFQAVPRFIWSLLFTIVVAIISIAGRTHLSAIILNFVSIVGYWSVAFATILFLEDRVFRRRSGYDIETWNQPERLPWGVPAVLALLAGYLAGGVPGMAQSWYVGPIAAKFGPSGGDVGLWMVCAITTVTYLPGRLVERHYLKR